MLHILESWGTFISKSKFGYDDGDSVGYDVMIFKEQGLAKELPVPRTVSGLKCTLNAFDGDSNGYAGSDNDDDDDDDY